MPTVTHETPQSSAISQIEYESELGTAIVTFRKAGEEIMVEVSPEELAEWLAAPSIGSWYYHNLRGR